MGKLLRLVLVVKRAESSTPQIQGPQHSLVQDSSGLEQNPAPSRGASHHTDGEASKLDVGVSKPLTRNSKGIGKKSAPKVEGVCAH